MRVVRSEASVRRGTTGWILLICGLLSLSACGIGPAPGLESQKVLAAEASPTPALPPADGGEVPAALIPSSVAPSSTPTAHPSPTPAPTATAAATETSTPPPTATPTAIPTWTPTPTPTPPPLHPLSVESMRQQAYPGSEITIERTLEPGANYDRFVASYLSEGNKIYALLTVPRDQVPGSGWPVILFNHGYIPPAQYRTTERYVAYVDALARSGYIVFRSDYRGHGNSEGEPSSGFGTPDYTIDVLNAVASIQGYPGADADRIGMWGHSMGGGITLRSMVTTSDIKAGVIWAGTVASFADRFESRWGSELAAGEPLPTLEPDSRRRRWLYEMLEAYGFPQENPAFYASISPNSYLGDLSGPIQLHHGSADSSVPVEYSITLESQIQAAGKPVELYVYEGDNHNISSSFGKAMARSIQFFDTYVKGAGN